MTRIQWVHEPDPPWNRTRGSPAPQTRHTIVPSPQGVLIFRAVRAMASTSAAGSSDGRGPLSVNWCMCGMGYARSEMVGPTLARTGPPRQPSPLAWQGFALLELAQDWLEVDGVEQGKTPWPRRRKERQPTSSGSP